MRETRVVRRRGRRRTQLFLLQPPPAFTGRLRLAVIGAGGRAELAARWTDSARAPLVFEVPIEGEPQAEIARADLLFEIEREADDAREAQGGRTVKDAPELLPARVQGHAPPPSARLYVVPWLRRPPADAALSALRRSRGLRLGLAAALVADPRRTSLVRRLEAEGRLQRIEEQDPLQRTESTEPPTPVWDLLPAPLGRAAWSEISGARLVAHIDACLARAVVAPLPAESGPSPAAPDGSASPRPAVSLPGLAGFPAEAPSPACVWHELLAGGEDLAALGRMIARWNRRYDSPRLLCATPRDWDAAREEILRRA